MRSLRAHLSSVIVLAIALTSSTANALPPTGEGAPPGRASASIDAEQPLPTVVPPENDAIANATVVPSLPFAASLSTLEATSAPTDPACAGNELATVWYAYTPPVTTWLTANTLGSDYNTTLSAYAGPPENLVQVACNDDADGPQSQIAFLASTGTTYYLMAAGVGGGGNLELTLEVRPPLAQTPVKTTSAWEVRPAVGAGLAWSQAGRRATNWALYLKMHDEPRVKVNSSGTSGFGGGWASRVLVFQEIARRRSDLLFYNTDSRRVSSPRGVNTRHWEWHPTMTEDWLLFGRRNFRARTDLIILQNRATRRSIVLDRVQRVGDSRFAEAGQVTGNYAVWYRCTPLCNVFLRDIDAGTTTKVPNPARRQQYSPGVAEDGTVYLVQSGRGCGTSIEILRHPLPGPTTSLAALPNGVDAFDIQVVDHGEGTASVYFVRARCSPAQADIYKFIDP